MSVANEMNLNMEKGEILHLGKHNWGEKMKAHQTFEVILSKKCSLWLNQAL